MSVAPPLTIAISFHDEERYLAAAVRSVLAQTMPDFELLLVDDGSRDRSLEIARSFTDRRVTVISDGRHLGLASRLNEIARRARSELVARMDADDVCHPTRLARQLEVIRRSGCDAVGTWAGLFGDANEPFAVVETSPLPPTRASALEGGI
ncbi:MAG TPA: glycosyltransferase family A protein, partial [Gaiellaceae bacterium]|nr:glycosyltransferase family A protein [Gaiellaceae bacterium]